MNSLYIKNGNVFLNGGFEKTNITVSDGIITGISSEDQAPEGAAVYDATGKTVVPGFIDLHTHGAVNVDVNAATAEDLEKISHFFATQGTTSWLCSVLTDTREQTLWCIGQFREHQKMESNGADLMGIHLEGPFLAAEYKGAMPEHLLMNRPDMELLREYQEAADGAIRYITVSPEVEGVTESIGNMKELGMTVGIGHSGADYDTAMKAIENGAATATHTFNAMKLMHQHFPAIMGAVLESDIYCEAICDGRHLHPAVVRLLLKVKGIDKVVAVTDSIMATGLPDGKYKLGVNDIVVVDGDAKLAVGGSRAGSTLTTGTALKNILKFTGLPLEKALLLLTENPAKLIGVFDRKGSIEAGKYADLVILNEENDVEDTFVKGKQIQK
ncbi:N-acetylglucosamine-6-phosphate deacetylase [Anaerobium acetethylicum]|uniref:N-acetylglucosamine-6-phosphate deacetylase n=1 Tax=Anaerobium acetethylicum TaxID=1619234 RepID=A0A1D3TTY7_9FIRM|nr:N-acetylglucosamine-6-phosphate deacetylase [Anaerobium acetethylicum]SCP97498.1 N-acetylglucosamine-6-phosphate deacetylase [Anaerobium acetethylicum]